MAQLIDAAEERYLHELQGIAQEILGVLQQARLALDDLNKGNELQAVSLIRRIKQLEEGVLHEILQARVTIVRSHEREALMILEKELNEMKVLAEEAEKALMHPGMFSKRKAKKLLQRLIKIANEAVEKEKKFVKILTSSGAILGYQTAFDAAVAYLIYKTLQPYAVQAGHKIDEMVYTMEKVGHDIEVFKNQVQNFVNLAEKAPGKAMNVVKDKWNKLGGLVKESTGIKLPGTEEPQVLNAREHITEELRRVQDTVGRRLKDTHATVGVPPPPPPQIKDTFEHMVPDFLMFAIGGAVIFVFVRYHLPSFVARVWRRRQQRNMIDKIVSEVERRNEARFRYIIAQLTRIQETGTNTSREILEVEGRLRVLRDRILSGNGTPEVIREFAEVCRAFEDLKRKAVGIVDESTHAIADAGTGLHDTIVKEVDELGATIVEERIGKEEAS